jgi:hypothetical protein
MRDGCVVMMADMATSPCASYKLAPQQQYAGAGDVQLGGLLGAALEANRSGRLSRFITGPASPAIALFRPEHTSRNLEGDWYGEHAGKWLSAAAKAVLRSGDTVLKANVQSVADYLVGLQGSDGYLGTYATERRFMVRQDKGPRTWDGAPAQRTWDIWTHSYLILGLLDVQRLFLGEPRYLRAASRIARLCWHALTEGGVDITDLGNHHGMSATVLLDAAVELYGVSGDAQHLALAERVLQQADQRPELELLRQALAGTDAAEISTGKAYQLCWNLVGLAKLHRATGDAKYLTAVQNVWNSIRRHHLTLGGGPWGGVGHRSREVFNHHTVFSPQGYVETCAVLSWLQLNRELLAITGEACYAEEIECTAYNDLLGAQAPNGEDWCYYSFPNGRRVHTTYWRCCKSSGAMALEELPGVAYGVTAAQDLVVNLYGPGKAELLHPLAGRVRLVQVTEYPLAGNVRLVVQPENVGSEFSLLLRVPSWAQGARWRVNGGPDAALLADSFGSYARIRRIWQGNDVVEFEFPMLPRVHTQISHSVQEFKAPDGSMVAQEVMRYDYFAITRGPLVYATPLIDGFKSAETLLLPDGDAAGLLEEAPAPEGAMGTAVRLNLHYRAPLVFQPYFEVGGRKDGAWRLTWMQVARASDLQSGA